MIVAIGKGFDSDQPVECGWCKLTINPEESKVIFGTGNSILAIYHKDCLNLEERDPDKIISTFEKLLCEDSSPSQPKK